MVLTRRASAVSSMTAPTNPVWRAVDRLLGLVFGGLARLRHTRSIHPRGITYAARVAVTPRSRRTGSQFFDTAASYDGLLRISRGAGFSGEVPDIIGWALRVEDAFGAGRPLDLLLASTG